MDYLKINGYENRTNLDGALLQHIENNNGIVCPYLDSGENGNQSVSVVTRGDKTYLLAGGDDYSATDTGGYVEASGEASCDCCGDSYNEDDLTHIDHDGNHVCEYCRDRHYTYAYGRRYEDYFPAEECVEVNGSYYWTDTIDHHDIYICEHDGEYYHMDNMTTTRDGMYCSDYVVNVQHAPDDDDWVFQDYVHELSDGTTCHRDDADEYQAEIDAEETVEA